MKVREKCMDLSCLRPWTVEKGAVGWEVRSPPKHGGTDGLVACTMSYPDARIIAAAPLMLAALQGSVAFLIDDGNPYYEDLVADVRAAIRAAGGDAG